MNSTTGISASALNDEMRTAALPVIIFVGVEILIGFTGNSLILYVFFFYYRKCNFRYFVLCLAITDTLSTLITMPGELITQMFWYIYPFPIFCRIKSFFNGFTIFSSAFCLFIISVDRYRKVCRPLKWQIKPKTALRLCLLQWLVSFALSLPIGFLSGTFSYQERYMGELVNVTVCEKDETLRFTKYPLIYTISKEVILSVIMVSMFVLYVVICQKLWKTKFPMVERAVKKAIADKKFEGQTDVSTISSKAERGQETSETLASTNTEIESMPLPDVSTISPKAERGQKTSETHESTNTEIESMSTPGRQTPLEPTPPQEQWNKMDVQTKGPITKKLRLRARRKTFIMLILTAVFIVTTILFLTLLNLIMTGILRILSNTQKSIYFFFFRLYFINHVLNPILFGVLDQEFRGILKQTWQCTRRRRDM